MESKSIWSAYDPLTDDYMIEADNFDDLLDTVMIFVYNRKKSKLEVSNVSDWNIHFLSSNLGTLDKVNDVVHMARKEYNIEVVYN